MTKHQKQILMKSFLENPYLKKEETYRLTQSLNISERRIKDWFDNQRRAKRRNGSLHMGE